ncbi:Murein DD-endopeptidase MepM and murein hydrolase activator NlpD, contain LysM domain [Ferrimonas sediminum]|uniref:Murein DD-endopeptidase MepM and murein hydrolase activator NlpD, contain LysM domain n=1 Tax=Ferrimonas sediminum TaxID=718193 RepID=A0A1G8UHT6_9GAMM|nr:M23 family metallopeptidase [Ferrimonas sediminum]SDJ53352.1 Murein DD-endopeptidase MepM and murein hydrolase activator NlpD, contain LysM domain [Ferrimonas sediminum]
MIYRLIVVILSVFASQAAALELQGALTQGSLIRAKVAPGSQVWLNEKMVRVDADGNLVMGFGRDAPLSHQLKVVGPRGGTDTHDIQLNKRSYRTQSIKGIAKKIMEPDPEAIARARKDSAQVGQARATDSDSLFWQQNFIWPVIGPITGVYGSQRIYNGVPKRPHFGVDVAVPTGTRVVAPADGVITLAVPDMFYSGGTLIIDHGYGVSSSFLHLSKLLVKPGTRVSQGQEVAEVGATGRVTGAHLDWRINWYGERLDPQLLVPEMPGKQKK